MNARARVYFCKPVERRVSTRIAALWLSLSLGCASSQSGGSVAVPETADETASQVQPSSGAAAVSSIQRRDVEAQLGRGLGDFLSRIELEPSLDGGKFQGFRVVALTDPELWAGVDLKVGDVVRRVNGADLEEPDAVFNTFVALKKAREVSVDLLREGTPRLLRLAIVGEPQPEPASKTTAPVPANPAQPATSSNTAPKEARPSPASARKNAK